MRYGWNYIENAKNTLILRRAWRARGGSQPGSPLYPEAVRARQSGSITKKNGISLWIFPIQGGGSRIPRLYAKFWWLMFLALKTRLFWPKVTFLFLNVPIAHIFFGDNDFDLLFDIYILMMFWKNKIIWDEWSTALQLFIFNQQII